MGIANRKILHTDILIIGGGTAGCYAALTVREHSDYSIIIAEKANIKRSGCLAAGVNAINAYIVKGRKPEDYVDYCRTDADGIVREDLLLSMSQGLNRVTLPGRWEIRWKRCSRQERRMSIWWYRQWGCGQQRCFRKNSERRM